MCNMWVMGKTGQCFQLNLFVCWNTNFQFNYMIYFAIKLKKQVEKDGRPVWIFILAFYRLFIYNTEVGILHLIGRSVSPIISYDVNK